MSATYETYSRRGSNVADKLLATAKRNPEGALLVAAGVALMMRGMGSRNGFWRSSSSRSFYKGSSGYPASTAGGNGHHDEYRESGGMMDKARERASEFGGRMKESAGEMADYADHMRRTAADKSSRIIGKTTSSVQHGVERMIEEQPLALALLGLAAGAAVAALVPPTRVEERTLGPLGERITEGAEEAGRRFKESAMEAGKRLASEGMAAAGERLASEGMAAVTKSFTEADRDVKGQSRSSTSAPSGAGLASGSTGTSSSGAGPSTSAGSGTSGTSAGSGTSSGSRPGTGSTSTASPGRSHENGLGKSDIETGSSFGPGSSGTGRAG